MTRTNGDVLAMMRSPGTVYMGKSVDSDRNTHCIPRSKRYRMLQTKMAGVVCTALPAKLAEPSSPSRAVAKCFRGEFFVPASSPQRHLPIESHSSFSAIDYQWAKSDSGRKTQWRVPTRSHNRHSYQCSRLFGQN